MKFSLKPYIYNPYGLKSRKITYMYAAYGSGMLFCFEGVVTDVRVSGGKVTVIVDGREVPFNQIEDVDIGRYY